MYRLSYILCISLFIGIVYNAEPDSNEIDFKNTVEEFLRNEKLTNPSENEAKRTSHPIDDSNELMSLAKMWSDSQQVKEKSKGPAEVGLVSLVDSVSKPSHTEVIEEVLDKSEKSNCFDVREDCAQLKQFKDHNFCEEMKTEMTVVCNKTCGFCGEGEPSKPKVDECTDKLKEEECKILNTTFGACAHRPEKMKEACAKTCKFCKLPVETIDTSCISSPFGCCWDGKTVGTGPKGSGCPVCEDDPSATFCNELKASCTSPSIKGELMVKYCPKTCGVCDGTLCRDETTADCETYKKDGLCSSKPDVMFTKCRKTCNLCLPPCKDHQRCKVITQFITCNDSKLGGELQQICPVSCGVCGAKPKPPVNHFLEALSSL